MECLGIIGTLFILLAFTRNNERDIRLLDGVGAMFFIAYGLTISSFSTVLLNALLVGIQVYKLLTR